MRDASTAVPSQRELQQSAVAELGQLALAGCPFDMLCDRAVSDLARHLDVRFVKLLELDREGRFLTIRAGCGWKPGLVGTAQVPADSGSQAGYTLGTADTVVVQDFRTETRFAPPKLLTDHGILCGVSVIVGPLDDPWGVLGVHESDPALCGFTRPDIDFVRSVANILWLYLKNERTRGEVERERAALRSFADAMPSLFSIVDSTGHYEFVNRAYAIHGIEPASIVGRSVADVVGEDQYRKLRPHMDQALAGNVVSFETALALATTGPRDFLVTYAPRRW
jgi:two-component system, chemotaxis family, CheB/CheR fusion protein